MAKSIDLATDASRRAALLLSYILAVCAFVAPCQPGASTAIIDRLSHSRALGPWPRLLGVPGCRLRWCRRCGRCCQSAQRHGGKRLDQPRRGVQRGNALEAEP